MTAKQRTQLMATWWPDACHARGWNPQDRALRLKVLSEAVGRELESASELDHLKDIDLVKAHLLAISRPDDLSAQVRQAQMPQTRAAHTIADLKTRIARVSPGNNYMRAIMLDRWNTTDWDQLSLDQLVQLLATLENRHRAIRARKQEAATAPSGSAPSNKPF